MHTEARRPEIREEVEHHGRRYRVTIPSRDEPVHTYEIRRLRQDGTPGRSIHPWGAAAFAIIRAAVAQSQDPQ